MHIHTTYVYIQCKCTLYNVQHTLYIVCTLCIASMYYIYTYYVCMYYIHCICTYTIPHLTQIHTHTNKITNIHTQTHQHKRVNIHCTMYSVHTRVCLLYSVRYTHICILHTHMQQIHCKTNRKYILIR